MAVAFLRNSLTHVWLLLVGVTLLSWWLGVGVGLAGVAPLEGVTDFTVTAAIILIAVIKVRFVIWHFMEVRHGPLWLKLTCDAWLIVLATSVLLIYRIAA